MSGFKLFFFSFCGDFPKQPSSLCQVLCPLGYTGDPGLGQSRLRAAPLLLLLNYLAVTTVLGAGAAGALQTAGSPSVLQLNLPPLHMTLQLPHSHLTLRTPQGMDVQV